MNATFQTVVVLIVLAIVLIGAPAAIIWTIVDYVKNGRKRERQSTGAAAFGNALQELDRLVARPSVEHIVEAETPVLRREDDDDGN